MLVLAQLPHWAIVLLVILFFFVCLLLILTVLIQRPAGGGLSGAFGAGAGSGQTAFGAKTGDALTIATIIMFVVFILGAIGLNYATRPETGRAGAAAAGPDGAGESEPKRGNPFQMPPPRVPTSPSGEDATSTLREPDPAVIGREGEFPADPSAPPPPEDPILTPGDERSPGPGEPAETPDPAEPASDDPAADPEPR